MRRVLALTALMLTICAIPVLPQEQHAAGGHAEHAESMLQIIARWANFAVLFGGLAYLLRKPLSDFFRTRKENILTGLQQAQDAQAAAKARLDEIEQRLAGLAAEISALRAEAEHESQLDREKVLGDARREVDRVVEQSRQEIERIGRMMQREIKEKIADQVIDRAGRQLLTQMTQDDQKRVVLRFVKNL
jgi:F-type H+-transporting ATPase subunit b